VTEQRATCIDPAAINDEDLIAFARGESTAAATHIDRCPSCRAEARDYVRLDPLLRARLFRRRCPETLTLGEYALDLLDTAERAAIAGHLVQCPHCREEAREFGAFLTEPDAPPPTPNPLGALRRIFAVPLPTLNPLTAGLRGGGAAEDVAYEAEGLRVIVSVQPGARPVERTIAGMIQGDRSLEGAPVRLFSGERLFATEAIDDLDSFLFQSAPPGTYRIELETADAIVVIDTVAAG
jgi:hypothetical protein